MDIVYSFYFLSAPKTYILLFVPKSVALMKDPKFPTSIPAYANIPHPNPIPTAK